MPSPTEPWPPHTPIVVCPMCTRHTAHVMQPMGQYTCQVCGTSHRLEKLRKVANEHDPVWCPVCRDWSIWWAQVQGQRRCRVCEQSIPVGTLPRATE
jgi:hypothetical protein